MTRRRLTHYLTGLAVDALGTTLLAVLALPSGSPGPLAVALLSAVGLLLAAVALGAREERGRRRLATGLLVTGLVVNTAGCAAVLLAQGALEHPLTLPGAVLLLLVGDALSLLYLRSVAVGAPYAA